MHRLATPVPSLQSTRGSLRTIPPLRQVPTCGELGGELELVLEARRHALGHLVGGDHLHLEVHRGVSVVLLVVRQQRRLRLLLRLQGDDKDGGAECIRLV